MQLHLRFDPNVPEGVRECEREVFGEAYGDTPEELARAYTAHEQCGQTGFLWVTGDGGEVWGFSRMIWPGPLPLRTFLDVAVPPWGVDGPAAARAAGVDPGRAWDVATFGVRRRTIGARLAGKVTQLLYRAVLETLRENGMDWVIAVIDVRVRALMASAGMPLHTLPGTGPAPYLGSPASVPVYGRLTTMLDGQRGWRTEVGLDGRGRSVSGPLGRVRLPLPGGPPEPVQLSEQARVPEQVRSSEPVRVPEQVRSSEQVRVPEQARVPEQTRGSVDGRADQVPFGHP
jgi:hypothetical protein